MLKSRLAAGAIAGLLGASGMSLLGSTAHALTPLSTGVSVTDQRNVHQIAVVRHGHRVWVYRRGYGPRYRFRHPGFGYYYGGWWYARPWWGYGPGWGPGWGWGPGINLCIGC
jgi:hypothetical protein